MVAWLGFKRLLSDFRRGWVLGGWGGGFNVKIQGSIFTKNKKNVVKTTPAAK